MSTRTRKAPARTAAAKTSPAAPVGAVGTAGDEHAPVVALAPVDPPDPEDVQTPTVPAPIFPTEADVVAVTATLLAAHPELADATERVFAREVRAALAEYGATLGDERARAKAASAHRVALDALVAPVFPTEAHVAMLDGAIPGLTDAEREAVILAGHAAFVASIAAGEPVTETPEASE